MGLARARVESNRVAAAVVAASTAVSAGAAGVPTQAPLSSFFIHRNHNLLRISASRICSVHRHHHLLRRRPRLRCDGSGCFSGSIPCSSLSSPCSFSSSITWSSCSLSIPSTLISSCRPPAACRSFTVSACRCCCSRSKFRSRVCSNLRTRWMTERHCLYVLSGPVLSSCLPLLGRSRRWHLAGFVALAGLPARLQRFFSRHLGYEVAPWSRCPSAEHPNYVNHTNQPIKLHQTLARL